MQKNTLQNKLKNIFKKELKANVKITQKIYDIKTWDSLANFNILLASEKEFGIKFSAKEFNSINSFKGIFESIKKKISLKELSDLLDKFKIKKGNSIVLHSNSAGLFQYGFQKKNEVYETFINTLIERVGASGTIIIPTYNYDFTKNKLYDKNKTLSKVGLFSNFF